MAGRDLAADLPVKCRKEHELGSKWWPATPLMSKSET